MLDIFILVTHSISALMAVFFIMIILLHNIKSDTNRSVLCIMISSLVLVILSFMVINTSSSIIQFNFARATMAVAPSHALFLLWFVGVFPQARVVFKRWLRIAVFSAYIAATAMGPFVFSGFDPETLSKRIPQPLLTPLMPLWGIIVVGATLAGGIIAFLKFRKIESTSKQQWLVILFGIIATFILIITTQFLPNVLFQETIGTSLIAINGLVYLPMMLGVGWAVVKYNLLNIKTVAIELLTLALWMVLLIRIFFDIDVQDYFIDGTILIGVVIIGVFLIRSVLNEVKQKEEMASLNKQLDFMNISLKDINENLEQKVAEQTVEIRKAYEVEKKARIELVELDKTKDQFILTTQHHLRTPLTIVKGYIQSFIAKKSSSLDEEAKSYITQASAGMDEIGSLVNEFLDISQMEIGKSILKKQPTNISEFVGGIVGNLLGAIQKRSLNVRLDIQKDIVINIDAVKFKEAIANIIDNAVKYNLDKGSMSINGEKITHPIEKDKQIFRLIIENTGVGITKEELSKLFTQYFQRGEVAEKLYTTGSGMGLVVAKNIIQAHDGRIYAESEGRDKGAKFVVELPA